MELSYLFLYYGERILHISIQLFIPFLILWKLFFLAKTKKNTIAVLYPYPLSLSLREYILWKQILSIIHENREQEQKKKIHLVLPETPSIPNLSLIQSINTFFNFPPNDLLQEVTFSRIPVSFQKDSSWHKKILYHFFCHFSLHPSVLYDFYDFPGAVFLSNFFTSVKHHVLPNRPISRAKRALLTFEEIRVEEVFYDEALCSDEDDFSSPFSLCLLHVDCTGCSSCAAFWNRIKIAIEGEKGERGEERGGERREKGRGGEETEREAGEINEEEKREEEKGGKWKFVFFLEGEMLMDEKSHQELRVQMREKCQELIHQKLSLGSDFDVILTSNFNFRSKLIKYSSRILLGEHSREPLGDFSQIEECVPLFDASPLRTSKSLFFFATVRECLQKYNKRLQVVSPSYFRCIKKSFPHQEIQFA